MHLILPVLVVVDACTPVPNDTVGLPQPPQSTAEALYSATPASETALPPAGTGASARTPDPDVSEELASVPQIENVLPVCRADGLIDLIGLPLLAAGQDRIPDKAGIIRPGIWWSRISDACG